MSTIPQFDIELQDPLQHTLRQENIHTVAFCWYNSLQFLAIFVKNKTEIPFRLKDDERGMTILTIGYANFDNAHENFEHL